MKVWLTQHGRSLNAALGRFAAAPLGGVLNIIVLGVALSLPAGLYVLIDNLRETSRHLDATPQITLFMALDASRADAAQIATRLAQHPRVQSHRFVPREQALQELKQSSGLGDVIDSLPQNPLPDAYVVIAREQAPTALEALRDEVSQWPRVAHAQLDAAWARRLDAALRLGTLVVAGVGALLAMALLAITFNTIRLQVLTRRDEIEVVKLIGATDAFIRRPFLYYGALQGCAGGLVAWLLLCGGLWLLNRNLSELSHLYASLFLLKYPSPLLVAQLVAIPAVLGWLGARLSVSRHLALLDRTANY